MNIPEDVWFGPCLPPSWQASLLRRLEALQTHAGVDLGREDVSLGFDRDVVHPMEWPGPARHSDREPVAMGPTSVQAQASVQSAPGAR